MATGIWLNPAARDWTAAAEQPDCRDFHARLPGYAPTPLTPLPALAARLGLGSVLVKDESRRFGLPAFKILGASWGVYRALCARLGCEPPWSTLDELGAIAAEADKPWLLTATAGNHGRAVARMARWLGLPAVVLVPATTSTALADAIEGEGAELRRVGATYDESVAAATELARRDPSQLLIQDTAWPGYTEVPTWIVAGYRTLFQEIDEQLGDVADLVVVPVGVGSLLGAAMRHLRASNRRPGKVLAVEPDTAACLLASLRAGAPVTVPTGSTVLEGMNAGTVSATEWPSFRDGLDAAITVTDADALAAQEELDELGVHLGPCGSATLAGLAGARDTLGLGPRSTVVLLGTDGR
jgi:diaminopropionate ammonia-lyase